MEKIKIGGVETFSIVDFPDVASAVIFMQGCPWRCPFCYNQSLQEIGKTTDIDWDSFYEFLVKRKGILDGVVFSGGEPLTQDALLDAILETKKLGYKIGLHTGGYRPEAFKKVLAHLDWVGLDIKAPLDKYQKAVGVCQNPKKIEESLDSLLASGITFECRTTCDPSILDIADIYEMANFLKNKGVKEYYLQKYRPIEGDKTSDFECEKFFADKDLVSFLKSSFEKFDIRK